MTLHQTTEIAKKVSIGLALGIGGLFLFAVLFRLGIIIKNSFFPPPVLPPTNAYENLPKINFPVTATTSKLKYTLNTVSGSLPQFPDRVNIYPLKHPQPNLLNLDKAKSRAGGLGFIGENGGVLPEQAIDGENYQWQEKNGLKRTLIMDTITFDFSIASNYLSSLTVLNAQQISNESNAINVATGFLNSIGLMPNDIDMSKTSTPFKNISYVTYPRLFSIQNGILTQTTSLSKTQVIRVDLYQKDIEYDLDTGIPEVAGGYRKEHVILPIIYPHPPYSTMSFWIASGQLGLQVVATNFTHKEISMNTDINATYLIKSAPEAFEELKNGKAYIASYDGTNTVAINSVYLAYYLGDKPQDYLMPVIVFEGENGFFAFVSAIRDESLK